MFTIGAFSTQLGVSPGTLRKWEERYGVPAPSRSDGGTRLYSADDLAQMREVVRRIDQGLRPGTVFAQLGDTETLQADAEIIQPAETLTGIEDASHAELIRHLLVHDPVKMRRALERELFTHGVTTFVESTAAPFMVRVGKLWQQGKLNVFAEHAVSSLMESVLHEATRRVHSESASPRILLTTPPGEQHRLGLSMIHSVMCAAGAECIDLGSELPLDELCRAIEAYRPHIVGVSFSQSTPPRYGMRFLRELCKQVAGGPEIWAGGTGLRKMTALPPGVQVFANAHAVQCRIEEMRRQSRASLGNRPQ